MPDLRQGFHPHHTVDLQAQRDILLQLGMQAQGREKASSGECRRLEKEDQVYNRLQRGEKCMDIVDEMNVSVYAVKKIQKEMKEANLS